MKVFISWSGNTSHAVALTLHDWLPNVIQAVEPYVSSEDIDKGARWSIDVSRELEDSTFGILVITPENIGAPWLNFEAGALAKSLEQSRVAPFLFGVQPSNITGPLVQFQAVVAQRGDVLKLVRSLNAACGEQSLDEGRLDDIFEVWWPRLDERLQAVGETSPVDETPSRTAEDLLTELLELVRGQQKLLADPETLFPPEYVEFIVGRSRPTPSMAAMRDLDRRWGRVEQMLAEQDEGELRPEVYEAIEALRIPVEYLARTARRPRPGYRPPATPPAESVSPSDDDIPF